MFLLILAAMVLLWTYYLVTQIFKILGPRITCYGVAPVQFSLCLGAVIASTVIGGQSMKVCKCIDEYKVFRFPKGIPLENKFSFANQCCNIFSSCSWSTRFIIQMEIWNSLNSSYVLGCLWWFCLNYHPSTLWDTSTFCHCSCALGIAYVQ